MDFYIIIIISFCCIPLFTYIGNKYDKSSNHFIWLVFGFFHAFVGWVMPLSYPVRLICASFAIAYLIIMVVIIYCDK